jgi:hypothetical protein
MKRASPRRPPDEKIVRDALLRLLKERGLEPREDWVSVRVVKDPWPRAGIYAVIFAYQAAEAALSGVLCASSAEKEADGVWVLNESEAHHLLRG